ncbi:MAG: LacI family DNA-binding transcriptional regulator [Sediminispirochaetaceae bacterium]
MCTEKSGREEREPNKTTVTIKDIARIAGVSHSTVSRSLNDSPLISDKTKSRIKQIAGELNFAFNSSAQSLSTRRTGTIGIIYPELFDTFGNSLYLGLLVQGLRHGLEQASLDSIGSFPTNHYTGDSNINKLISRKKVDGLLLIHPEIPVKDWEYISSSGIPFVVLHFKPRSFDYSLMNYLFTDHVYGGYMATRLLTDAGCRKILCLREDSREIQFIERTEGYMQALQETGISFDPGLIRGGDCSFEFGYNTIMNSREELKSIDGVFAEADLVAIGAIEAMKELGIRIPEDIKVVGYDDTELGKYFRPKLTTIHQPREEHARLACERLIQMLDENDTSPTMQKILKPLVIYRETC